MASIAELNVKIGAEIKGLQDGIRAAERELRKAGQALSAAGNALTYGLTLPIIGMGVAAIKSAGDMEALRKAMVATFAGAGRSVEEANKEVEALRKAAEAPGLDFPQAVQASLRLQGVGFSAEKARNTIVQLANAIATTGGTAENLNGVTVQFAQIISKGKVLEQDLRVIKENMPGLSKIMQETFGTTTAEGIRALGVSGQEFVEKITAAMEKLPRVEGGISNSIVNAGTAIKMFLADVGESLNKTLNVTGRLDAFSSWLDGMGKKFSALDESTRTAIIGVGIFAAALGPAIKVGGLLIQVSGAIVNGLTAMYANLLQAGSAIGAVTAWWNGLNMAMKLSVIGAAIGVILALAIAFKTLEKDMSASAQAQRAVADVSKIAGENIAAEKVKTDLLIATLNNENASRSDKAKALKELQAISPEYFGKLDIENGKVKGLTTAYDAYIAALLRSAKAAAARDKLVEIEKALLNLSESAQPTVWQTFSNAISTGGSAIRFASTQAKTLTDNLKDQKTVLEAQRLALAGVVVENEKAVVPIKAVTNATVEGTKASKERTKAAKEELARLQEAAAMANGAALFASMAGKNSNQKPLAPLAPTRDTGLPPIVSPTDATKMVEGLKVVGEEAEKISDQVWDALDKMQHKGTELGTGFQALAQSLFDAGEVMKSAAFAATDAMIQYADQGGTSFAALGQSALAATAKVVRAYLQQAIAAVIAKSAFATANPLAALILGGIAGAGVGVLFNKLVAGLGVKGFAHGTQNAPPGLALVGEVGPELVSLPGGSQVNSAGKTRAMLNSMRGDSGLVLQPSIRYEADGFRIMLERADRRNARVSGRG